MAARSSGAANATVNLSQKLKKMTADGSQDYNSWRKLISEIETATSENIDTISLAYDSFLSAFPLCHWHLEKYAYHKAKLCGTQEAVKIYERGVGTTMFSVGFWVDYFTFSTSCFQNPEDVRRLFGRALSFVGKDYYCHVLWDKYMKYEFDRDGWSFLAHSYIQTLRFPTKKLQFYYNNFKQFFTNLGEEIGYEKDNNIEVEKQMSKEDLSLIIKDLLNSPDISVKSKALEKYRSLGEEFFREACHLDEKIKCFEMKIGRQYFSATPLDDDQLNNWHLYLDFIEKQDNLDWAVKLYERCLIPCANYPEFWMRYVDFLESKGGRELAISALDRATQIFLKNVPEIHFFNARFKEHIGDANGARAALLLCDAKTESSFIEKVATQANLERRLGNFAAASATYEKALKTAKQKQKPHFLPTLYSQFARLTFVISGNAAAARDILIKGVQNVPHCRFLLEELVKFAMTHEGASQVNIIDSVIADAISPGLNEYEGLNAKDRENISCLFLEFVNLRGTTHDIRKAWDHHIELFPQSLRIKPTYKKSTSRNSLLDGARDQNDNYAPAVQVQPQGCEQVLESPPNLDMSTKAVVLANEDASKEDKPWPTVVRAELADEQKVNILSSRTSDQGPSGQSGEFKPGKMDVDGELVKQNKEHVAGPTTESPQVHSESDRNGSVGRDSVEKDQQNSGGRKRSQGQLGDFEEDKAGDREGPTSSAQAQTPSQSVSYPQQNMKQISSPNDQQLWQTHQNLAMNQMLQYQQYQQQYFQQQQQQMQMQHPYYQYMSQQQQPYQLQPQQQNQQQHYVQQQQNQDLAYQSYQLAYQQYQQYQGYQNMQNQHQSQQTAPPDHGGVAEPSDSPHHRDKSPLQ